MVNRLRQLLEACAEGNAWIVSAILSEGADVDVSDDNDEVTALQVASANGHEHLVHLLIMKGATIDKANSSGWTPLLHAARHGHTNIVALLLQNQANINAKTNLGANAMTLAARGGHLQMCQLLEDCGIDQSFPNDMIDGSSCEFTPAMVAALHGHDNILRHLLDRGSDVNYQTPTLGMNSLMFSAVNGHMTTAQILIERGANPDLCNVNDNTPLEITMPRGSREFQNYLDRKTTRKPRTAYHDIKPDIIDATRHGDIQRIREILDQDATQCDACSPQDGATPLMFAAMAGRLDIAKLLVEKGCDVNNQDVISGWTALMQATFHGKPEMVKYLISVGADVNIAAINGCTTFDLVTFMETADRELCRLIALKAMPQSHDHVTKKTKAGREESASTAELISTDSVSEEYRSGLKAWWNRMSNRFRNLKLGRTFSLNASRSTSMDEMEVTIKNLSPSPASYQNVRKPSSNDTLYMTKKVDRETSTNATDRRIASDHSSGTTLYTLGMLSSSNSNPLNNTIKPLPPFSTPPSFQTNGHKMPPISLKKSIVNRLGSTPTLVQHQRGFTGRSTLSLAANAHSRTPMQRPVKPSYASTQVSPSASSEASALNSGMSTARSKVASSASSSTGTLTAGSGGDNFSNKATEVVRSERKANNAPATFDKWSNDVSGDSSLTSTKLISLKPHLPNSSQSNASTLTPSPMTPPKSSKRHKSVVDSRRGVPLSLSNMSSAPLSGDCLAPDDIGRVLQQLSLERYHAIFEEQEVDMEAFLTLTDGDLIELGISNGESRHRILATINELNLNKDRERQHYQQAISHFNSTLRQTTSFNAENSEILDYREWNEDGTIEH